MNAHKKSRDMVSAPRIRMVIAPEMRADLSEGEAGSQRQQQIKIGKAVVSRKAEGEGVLAEVFTMTIGTETIELLPLKNWTQLDAFKWRTRGILPRTPAGLEITPEHLKVAGETVSTWEPDACAKVEKAFNDWLALEQETLKLAKEKAQTSKAPGNSREPDEDVVHFQVELDSAKAGQPRLRCLEGRETVKVVALNQQGFNALFEQGLMRRPRELKVGALHDWVELDGELFRLEKDANGARELEKALNERYVSAGDPGAHQDVMVFPNPASPTGFDIQFPATPNGLVENRKQHLNQQSMELLQNPEKCRVLRKGTLAKLTPPELIFKRKTPDGGERYLDPGPETIVSVTSDDGQAKTIDLSQPVNLLNLSARELTAVFNHPAVNRRARLARTAAPQAAQGLYIRA